MELVLASLMALALAQDEDLLKEYKTRRVSIKDDDIEGILKLAEWCNDQGLRDLAEAEWERILQTEPDHAAAREKLGFKRSGDKWVDDERREARKRLRVALKGLRLPKEKPKTKTDAEKDAVDFLFYRENWFTALDAIDKRSGLFSGPFEVALSFTKLGKGKAMRGFGQNGAGSLQVDLEECGLLFKAYQEYENSRKDPASTIVLSPVVRPMNLLIRELVHCFMWEKLPPVLIEGMAAYASKDATFLFQYSALNVKLGPVHECPTEKDQHVGRGYAFFEYVEAKAGVQIVKFIASRLQNEHRDWREIVESSLRMEWADVAKEELEWTANFLKDYAPARK